MAAELPLQLWQETADQSAVLLKQSFSSADVQPIHRGRQGTSNKTRKGKAAKSQHNVRIKETIRYSTNRWRNRYKGANKLFAQVFQKLTNIRAKNKNQDSCLLHIHDMDAGHLMRSSSILYVSSLFDVWL
ncbi:hypothetical protein Y1Q_0014513 [Alligator mississippiensis]|uniref:Uncharacterized protein n=1 Tax=Alligator mississippiensis TaxID=8496 RepID=A0A151PDC2_ALLMI|nr:hypothetical protein Y1Q_0014513 [Alligator mississippiensis]